MENDVSVITVDRRHDTHGMLFVIYNFIDYKLLFSLYFFLLKNTAEKETQQKRMGLGWVYFLHILNNDGLTCHSLIAY